MTSVTISPNSANRAPEQQKKKLYLDMCADLMHLGHVNVLKQAKQLFPDYYVLVGIHSDNTIESYKRRPVLQMSERIAMVEACRYVDEVVPNAPLRVSKDFIHLHQIDVVLHAHSEEDDHYYRTMCYKEPSDMGIFIRLPYTSGISTTEIIKRILNRAV